MRTDDGLVINPPKTRNGWRTVPLSLPVAEAVREQRAGQLRDLLAAGPSWIGSDHVFTTEAGTPLDPRNTGRWFTSLASVAGATYSVLLRRRDASEVVVSVDSRMVVGSVGEPPERAGGMPVRGREAARAVAVAVEAVEGSELVHVTSDGGVGGSLHSLRHTALTSMALAGVPLSVVSRVAGHESITTTIDLYGNLTEQAARDAVAAAAGRLGLA